MFAVKLCNVEIICHFVLYRAFKSLFTIKNWQQTSNYFYLIKKFITFEVKNLHLIVILIHLDSSVVAVVDLHLYSIVN